MVSGQIEREDMALRRRTKSEIQCCPAVESADFKYVLSRFHISPRPQKGLPVR
jgi:hypothetical protein